MKMRMSEDVSFNHNKINLRNTIKITKPFSIFSISFHLGTKVKLKSVVCETQSFPWTPLYLSLIAKCLRHKMTLCCKQWFSEHYLWLVEIQGSLSKSCTMNLVWGKILQRCLTPCWPLCPSGLTKSLCQGRVKNEGTRGL